MRPFLAIGLACTAAASVVRRDDMQDTVRRVPMANSAAKDAAAIAKLLKDVNTGLKGLNTAISGISKANVNSQLDKAKNASLKMNDLLKKDAAALKSSKPFGGILTATQLLNPATTALKTANQTRQLILQKRPVILEAKLEGKVKDVFVALKPGLTALIIAFPSQIPPSVKKQIESKIGGPIPPRTAAEVGPIIDKVIDTIIDVYSGKTPPPDLAALAQQFGKGAPSPDVLAGKGSKGKIPRSKGAKGKVG
jgi:hypothetical protein